MATKWTLYNSSQEDKKGIRNNPKHFKRVQTSEKFWSTSHRCFFSVSLLIIFRSSMERWCNRQLCWFSYFICWHHLWERSLAISKKYFVHPYFSPWKKVTPTSDLWPHQTYRCRPPQTTLRSWLGKMGQACKKRPIRIRNSLPFSTQIEKLGITDRSKWLEWQSSTPR